MTALPRRVHLGQVDAGSPIHQRPIASDAETFTARLLREGVISAHEIVPVLIAQAKNQSRIADLLLAQGIVEESKLYQSIGRHWGCGVADLETHPPDARLLAMLNMAFCLREGVLPWRITGQAIVIAMAYPENWDALRPRLTEIFGTVIIAVAPMRRIEATLLRICGPEAAALAESRVSPEESCRDFDGAAMKLSLSLGFFPLAALVFLYPAPVLVFLTLLASALTLAHVALKLMAWQKASASVAPDLLPPEALPEISIMIALYKEVAIVNRLIKRLDLLNYPRDKLDLILIVEADDAPMRAQLATMVLPSWMRVLLVPQGRIKTKPRALNHALGHCRGEIVGIYDAEDAPEALQLHKVAAHFSIAQPDVACLQGRLDYYNPRSNWLARCFTIEYASWFRLFLPGIAALGLVVPLGGTTLFFKRNLLENLGGWDAHNVTEDADLGLRLARHGYRTEIVDTTTMEEANCRTLPWIRQRSRWIKGYMLTWATHMRDPSLLWRQLGARRFIGVQVLMLGSVIQSLIAPVLWSLLIIPLGFPHPITGLLPHFAFVGLYSLSFVVEALNISFGIAALLRSKQPVSPLWVPTLMLYYPLATFAAYKALWELLTRPFYWDKTSHGLFDV